MIRVVLELASLQNDELRETLLRTARNEIARVCGLPARTAPASTAAGRLEEFDQMNASGVFVSLHRGGRLRGCIGKLRLDSVGPQELGAAAMDAACCDPRFQPVCPDELGELRIEISLLGPLSRCEPEQVVIGQHGLYLRNEDSSGLLLPQVAVERAWGRTEFLQQLRRKAGLGPTPTASEQLWCFRAVVFDEDGNLRTY